jgi:hypothetical protein
MAANRALVGDDRASFVGETCEQSNLIDLVVTLARFYMPFSLSPLNNMLAHWQTNLSCALQDIDDVR